MTNQRRCGTCGQPGHNKRTCDGVSRGEWVDILTALGGEIEERFPETGFVYFGDNKRVFWKLEDDAPKSPSRITEGDIWINESAPHWGYPTPQEVTLLYKLLYLYIQWARQQERAEIAAKSPLHQLAVESE